MSKLLGLGSLEEYIEELETRIAELEAKNRTIVREMEDHAKSIDNVRVALRLESTHYLIIHDQVVEVVKENAKLRKALEAVTEEIAQEAHMLGRIYERTASPVNPAIEFNRVSDMAKRKLKQVVE